MNESASHPPAQTPPPHPAAELAARIDAILAALLLVIGAHQRILGRFTLPVWTRISRLRRRFARLLARPLTDTAAPRPDATPRPDTARSGGPNPPYIPRRHGWLVHVIGYQAAAAMSHLEHLFRDPAIQEILAAASPRWLRAVGRPLRPLCRLLHVTPPEVFQPPNAPAPRPPSSRQPTPPRAAPSFPSHPPSPPASPTALTLDGPHPPPGLRFFFRSI